MTIAPDDKDWTWVLDRRCPQCGFDAGGTRAQAIPGLLRANARGWQPVLFGAARDRPAPMVWSPLEYGCHVRDVLRLQQLRVGLMLGSDRPMFVDWDQDAAAVSGDYGRQDPPLVAEQIADAAEGAAGQLDGLADEQWARPGSRGDGAVFTVRSFAQYFLHDVVHHLHDVGG